MSGQASRDERRTRSTTTVAKGGEGRRGGRGMTGARWDDSRDDCCGKTIGVMVRLPVWGKGGWRERDGPADSAGRSASRRMECD